MSHLLEKLRDADFTGLNRSVPSHLHWPNYPANNHLPPHPPSSQDNPHLRSARGLERMGDQDPNPTNSLLDDEDTGLTQIIIRGLTLFFLFINLFIYIAIAVFQKVSPPPSEHLMHAQSDSSTLSCHLILLVCFHQKWAVGPSGLTGLAIVRFLPLKCLYSSKVSYTPLFFSLCPRFMSAQTCVIRGFARAIRLTRIQFIVYGTQTGLALVLSSVSTTITAAIPSSHCTCPLIATISAYTGGCKDPKADPNASNTDYISNIGGFCRNKRAAAAFWWFSFLSFGLSLAIVFKSWYSVRKLGPRHPAFEPPQGVGVRTVDDDDDDDDFRAVEPYEGSSPPRFPQEMTAVRPSNVGGYYGERPIFDSDRAPAGYAAPSGSAPPIDHSRSPPPMAAYKDPFDEIRAQIYQAGR
ncbi:hypothetical protein VP01_2042g2 [Puccinia sorghi]|uniref:Uncharacterized protein n=1 Tax=Puccinia sorghi TaxID=27349 RepID=A0A0L6VAU8_9BASI|nr:hypothetical protein VP01_2042g2 [Puccinia sorghi]